MEKEEMKTVKVSLKTHSRLENLGTKGETFDQIIIKLLEEPYFCGRFETALELAEQSLREFTTTGKTANIQNGLQGLIEAVKAFLNDVKSR